MTTQDTKDQVETIKAYYCESCDIFMEETGGNLYECGDCGTMFTRETSKNDNHQCPDCNKFSGKTGDEACSECQESPVEEVMAFSCDKCGELHREDNVPDECEESQEEDDEDDGSVEKDTKMPSAVRCSEHGSSSWCYVMASEKHVDSSECICLLYSLDQTCSIHGRRFMGDARSFREEKE